MRVEINRVLVPVTVLGAGRRVGLWVQGCGLACHGCASVDTWAAGEGYVREVDELAAEIVEAIERHDLDGLTLTGGEPLDQAEALAELVRSVRRALSQRPGAFDVLVFTGYSAAAAARRAGPLWPLIDAIVCGPYRADLPSEVPLVASANQELVTTSSLGEILYPLAQGMPRIQVLADGDTLSMIGLPRPGDLDLLAARLEERGVVVGSPSWRT